MSAPVRIPADVDLPDRLIGPLTARQVAILAVTGLVLYTGWTLTRALVPMSVFLALAIPLAASAAVVALGQRDGISLDRLLLAAIRQRVAGRHRFAVPENALPAPAWLRAAATGHDPTGPGFAGREPATRLRLPVQAVTDTGVIDLGDDGLALVAVASTVNFALRTPTEQDALVASFAHYLHSLAAPVQILIRTHRLDLSSQISELRQHAETVEHPALHTAALEHARFLTQLGERAELLHRQVLLVFREDLRPAAAAAELGSGSPWAMLGSLTRGQRHAEADGERIGARRTAEARLVRRLGDAIELLAPAGIVVTALNAGQAAAVLATACNPDTLLGPSARLASAHEVITTPRIQAGHDRHGGRHHGHTAGPDDAAQDDWGYPDEDDEIIGREWGQGAPATPSPSSVGGVTPDTLSVGTRHLEVGSEWVASFAVAGFPREVHPGWLTPLLTYPARLDVAVHVEPIDPATAASRLKKQLARLESGRRRCAKYGRLEDPMVEAATEDAYELSTRVARGEGQLFRVGLYLTIHADSQEALSEEVAALRSLCASLLLDAKHTSYRSLQGWVATLPMGLDPIGMRRTFDTSALAAAFPFTSPDLPPADPTSVAAPAGVFYGHSIGSQGLVHWDRFACDNHNSVILGRSGAGKSYLVKLELLRSLYRGVEIHVIDPEQEYARLAGAVGGTQVQLGSAGVRLNPFDLPITVRPDGRRTAPQDALIRRCLFLHTVISVLLGTELSAGERAVLDRGITATYQRAGITADSRTWTRPAPTLADLREVLAAAGDPAAAELATRLHPWVQGAFRQLFDGATTTEPDGHLVVFSLWELPEELKAIGTLLTLDAVWRRVRNPAIRRPRLVVVDEAWLLMRQPAGAEFLFRMAKASRKHWAGLTVATQDSADVLGSDLGKAVVANAATQILLRQAPQTIDEITRTFDLSAGERQFLLSADRGQGLLCAGTHRAAFHAVASPTEHYLATTDPAELADNAHGPNPDTAPAYVDLGFANESGSYSEGGETHIDLGVA
ncbi:MAG TPA: PrgI family protein [Mycobacterium sp.]|nr:PrgI family protein [Mycobacterium sp.]